MKKLMVMLVTMMLVVSCGKNESKSAEVKTEVKPEAKAEEVKAEVKTQVEPEIKVEEKKSEPEPAKPKPAPLFAMKKSVWVCDFCSLTITSDNTITGKCPNRTGLPHISTEVGKEGNETYTCGNCNCKIQVSNTPRPGKCFRGSPHPVHSWKRQY